MNHVTLCISRTNYGRKSRNLRVSITSLPIGLSNTCMREIGFNFIWNGLNPTAEDLDQIRDARHIQQEMFTRAFSFRHWSRVHQLNLAHQKVQEIRPVYRCCNALLEVEPHEITEDYDVIECYIPFSLEKDQELGMIQSIHSLLDRCHLSRLFYYYQKGSLILSVYAKPQD